LVPVEGHGRLQAEGVARPQAGGAGSGLQEAPPEGRRVLRIDVQLEAVLAGVAGARDERRAAVHLALPEAVVAERRGAGGERLEDLLLLGTLEGDQRPAVALVDDLRLNSI